MATSLLLADDSPTIAKILGMALASEDYQIRSVLTADDAIRELKANPPFFFLIDLTLPVKNGFEFARMIRSDSKLAKIKVVLLSSAFEPVDDAAVKACGADLVIAKPFDPSELRAALRNIKDAPPKFASGAKVSGSLSGFAVTATEGTRTSLTDTDLMNARAVISKKADSPAPEELLLGMQSDLDANSILAGLAENAPGSLASEADSSLELGSGTGTALRNSGQGIEVREKSKTLRTFGTNDRSGEDFDNATAMLDLSGHIPSEQVPEPVLDLSNAFGTPVDGTAMMDIAGEDFNGELVLGEEVTRKPVEFDTPPPAPKRAPPTAPPSTPSRASAQAPRSVTPPSPAKHPELSPNAEALAAFFSAEIDNNKEAPAPVTPPPLHANEAEEFEKSMASIEWDNSAATDLDSWSASSQTAPPPAPAKGPVISAPAPRSAAPPAAARPAAPAARPAAPTPAMRTEPASFLFDTGGSSFRFAEDYITRITKSFVGHAAEEMPKDFSGQEAPMFPQASNDSPRGSGGGGAGNWNPMDAQKMEQIVREEVQMAVREVVEKIAWEVIPELAENLIKKELERVMKQLES